MKGVIIFLIIVGLLIIGGAFLFINQGSEKTQLPETDAETDIIQAGTEIPSKTIKGKTYKVEIKDFKLPDLTINVGDTIEWTNLDTAPHTATAVNNAFDTDRLEKGDAHSITFDKPGTYSYYCSVHPYMKGTVTVR